MKYIVWGATGQAKVVYDILASCERSVALFVDNRKINSPIAGVPIVVGEIGLKNWLKEQDEKFYGAVAIGGEKGNDRLNILSLFAKNGIDTPMLAHSSSFIASTAHVFEGTQILPKACICANALVKKGVIVNTGSILEHDCIIEEGVHIAPGCTLCGCIHVERNVFVGAGTTILPRVTIGANSIIGAGSVVTKDIPQNMIAMGAPINKLIPLKKE